MSKKVHITALLLAASSAFSGVADFSDLLADKGPALETTAVKPGKSYFCWPMHKSWASFNSWINFLYWQPLEDNVEPAGLKKSLTVIGFQGRDDGAIVNMDFAYKPGFQIGFGTNFNYGRVDLSGEYTRFHATTHLAKSGKEYFPMQLDPGTLLAFLNGITNAAGGLNTAGIPAAPLSFDETWKLTMDLADLNLGSWHTRGKIIESHPFIGLRAAWIDQSLDVAYGGYLLSGGFLGNAGATSTSHSWAIGPRGGIATNWKIAKGLKLYWDAAGDILYTNYDWRGQSFAIVPTAGVSTVGPVFWSSDVIQSSISTLRTHFDIDLGLRWGLCFNEEKTRFELSAGYEFQVFFDQNMFRHFTTMIEEIGIAGGSGLTELVGVITTPISNEPNGNLYLQGLKVSAEFAF